MKCVKLKVGYGRPVALALGFFDCMHQGHRKILSLTRAKAAEHSAETALFTFENNFFPVLGRDEKLVYTYSERKAILERLSLDILVTAYFDRDFMCLPSDSFLQFLSNFDIKSIVCGFDYHFGSDRADAYKMQGFAEKKGIDFFVHPPVVHDGVKISTTMVRYALQNSRIDLANFYLGDRYFLTGKVGGGRRVGHLIGFPTANIAVSPEKLLPLGVFAGGAVIDGTEYPALVNIGGQPTFDSALTTVEAHFLGYAGNLYGKELTVCLDKFLRPTQRFSDKEKLINQIKKDIKNLR